MIFGLKKISFVRFLNPLMILA